MSSRDSADGRRALSSQHAQAARGMASAPPPPFGSQHGQQVPPAWRSDPRVAAYAQRQQPQMQQYAPSSYGGYPYQYAYHYSGFVGAPVAANGATGTSSGAPPSEALRDYGHSHYHRRECMAQQKRQDEAMPEAPSAAPEDEAADSPALSASSPPPPRSIVTKTPHNFRLSLGSHGSAISHLSSVDRSLFQQPPDGLFDDLLLQSPISMAFSAMLHGASMIATADRPEEYTAVDKASVAVKPMKLVPAHDDGPRPAPSPPRSTAATTAQGDSFSAATDQKAPIPRTSTAIGSSTPSEGVTTLDKENLSNNDLNIGATSTGEQVKTATVVSLPPPTTTEQLSTPPRSKGGQIAQQQVRRKLELVPRPADPAEVEEALADPVKTITNHIDIKRQVVLQMALMRESLGTSATGAMSPAAMRSSTIRPGFFWRQYPPLEAVLYDNMAGYYEHSAISEATPSTQKLCKKQHAFNNNLVAMIRRVAEENDFQWSEELQDDKNLRDRIRCFYKTHIQNAKKRLTTMMKNEQHNDASRKQLRIYVRAVLMNITVQESCDAEPPDDPTPPRPEAEASDRRHSSTSSTSTANSLTGMVEGPNSRPGLDTAFPPVPYFMGAGTYDVLPPFQMKEQAADSFLNQLNKNNDAANAFPRQEKRPAATQFPTPTLQTMYPAGPRYPYPPPYQLPTYQSSFPLPPAKRAKTNAAAAPSRVPNSAATRRAA